LSIEFLEADSLAKLWTGSEQRIIMKTLIVLILVAFSFLSTGICASAQQKADDQSKPAPQFKLVEFHMALLKRGPNWSSATTQDSQLLQQQHVAYVQSLLESGKAIIAGPLNDDGDIRGIYVLRAKSADEAKSWALADPAVSSGRLIAEMHPWWSADVMKKATLPLKLTTAYLGFLNRGKKWTPEQTPATQQLQEAHLANINRLAALKKLVVAGPFGDDGNLRGIFVFRVATLEEARSLAETDPAVQAGRLEIDMHPWLVPEGILP
jgi:uncharacterized protein YciI